MKTDQQEKKWETRKSRETGRPEGRHNICEASEALGFSYRYKCGLLCLWTCVLRVCVPMHIQTEGRRHWMSYFYRYLLWDKVFPWPWIHFSLAFNAGVPGMCSHVQLLCGQTQVCTLAHQAFLPIEPSSQPWLWLLLIMEWEIIRGVQVSDGFDKRSFFGVISRIHLGESSKNGVWQRKLWERLS